MFEFIGVGIVITFFGLLWLVLPGQGTPLTILCVGLLLLIVPWAWG